jgi:hypothetical protein
LPSTSYRRSKKSLRDVEHPPEEPRRRRRRLMNAAEKLAPNVGMSAACQRSLRSRRGSSRAARPGTRCGSRCRSGTLQGRRPKPLSLPEAVWINPPERTSKDHEKGLPRTDGSRKPDAPSAHPRSGYPSPGCVPAEPDSVSPDNATTPDLPPRPPTPLGHPSYA